jgi:holo-[acyl-carrier protein] synthase
LIFGIGTDIIEVSRIKKQIEKEKGFKERIFTPAEIEYCEKRKTKAFSYAARFAAKESLFKALGTGWREGIKHKDVEILNDDLGKPDIVVYGKTKELVDAQGIKSIKISISHIEEFASAVVVMEK